VLGEPWQITIGDHKITGKIHQWIHDKVDGDALCKWWMTKNKFTEPHQVDWDSLQKAMANTSRTRQMWITKMAAGICGVNKMMQIWGLRESAHCPRCPHATEDTQHVLLCPNEEAIQIWESDTDALYTWMINFPTDRRIAEAIIQNLKAWRNRTSPEDTRSTAPHLLNAIAEQQVLGWTAFVFGMLSPKWAQAQAVYLEFANRKCSGYQWAASLIRKIWEIAWHQWEHRNLIQHGKDLSVPPEVKTRTREQAQALFDHGSDTVLPVDNFLFGGNVSNLLHKSHHDICTWINQVKAAQARAYRRSLEIETPEAALLRRWLRTQHRPSATTRGMSSALGT
jgi:hypothetical protein